MTAAICYAQAPYLAESGLTELVRDNEQLLLERMMPLVEHQSISLDLHAVTRIDAAGLSVLIKLYCAARKAGHTFRVLHPAPHVAQILALVGLDGFLQSQDEGRPSCSTRHEKTRPYR